MNDSISRQQAIDLINARLSQPCKNHTSEFVQGMEDGYCRIRSDIKCLPPAQPHWIPCSERLPDSGRYLVSCPLSVFSQQVLNYDADAGEWFYDGCKSIGYEMPTINAWMPLPEPYGGESNA